MDNLLSRVNNNLLQEGATSNQYLRRQELRKQMEDGNYDKDSTNQATQPSSNATLQPTLAQTYSSLLNNYNNIIGSSTSQTSSGTSQGTSGGYSGTGGFLNIPSWLPAGVSMAGALSGNGLYGTLASNAMKIAGGNVEGGIGGLSGLFAGMLSGGKIPSGLVSTGVSGLLSGRDPSEIGKDMVNSGIGYSLGMANPVLGIGYGIARMLGFNPAYGLNNLFGNGLDGVAPGFTGTGYGFFGNNAIGSGIRSTPGNITNAGYSSSGSNGYSGYTPSGYESGDLGSGITNTSNGYGISGGGIKTPKYSWGGSGYSPSSSDGDTSGDS